MRRLPLRFKLTIAFVVVMSVVLGATGLFLYLRFGSGLDDTLNKGLKSRASDVKALVRQADSGLAQEGHDPLAERGERVAQILDSNGRVIDTAPGLPGGPALTRPQVRAALHRSLFVGRVKLPGAAQPLRLYATPVEAQGKRLVVVVGATLDDHDEALSELGALLLIGGPAALVLASLTGFVVTAAALRPVEAMRRRASAISAGERGQRLPVPRTRDEIGRLGETLNEMLARLETAFERERTFVADASHELRTPLAILKTELELALRRGRTVAELEAALRSAAEETDRLAQLAEDLLVMARSDHGQLPLRTEAVDTHGVLEAVRGRYARRAGEADMKIEVMTPDGVPLVADRLRLDQALGNLVDNALRYGSGPIELGARPVDGRVEISVRDHGDGFPPEFVAEAFERFTRANTARPRGGAGLGLAIVRAIAEAHGGTATATNVPDAGARITILLPAGVEAAQVASSR